MYDGGTVLGVTGTDADTVLGDAMKELWVGNTVVYVGAKPTRAHDDARVLPTGNSDGGRVKSQRTEELPYRPCVVARHASQAGGGAARARVPRSLSSLLISVPKEAARAHGLGLPAMSMFKAIGSSLGTLAGRPPSTTAAPAPKSRSGSHTSKEPVNISRLIGFVKDGKPQLALEELARMPGDSLAMVCLMAEPNNKSTLLHAAAEIGSEEVAKAVIAYTGASSTGSPLVNAQDKQGTSSSFSEASFYASGMLIRGRLYAIPYCCIHISPGRMRSAVR